MLLILTEKNLDFVKKLLKCHLADILLEMAHLTLFLYNLKYKNNEESNFRFSYFGIFFIVIL
ncbi:hypothetical protein T190130A13A_90070 [Tenacibaculum sp. 190130A14a]|uniref:Uncharacterized protein n=1 Tax=Tenacibaculum polynesiense TaxID=3137857 RepID=A0ABM9P6D4_9FLAO